MAGQPVVAAEILDFTDLSGNGATGQLILDQPLGVAQYPLVGSYFDIPALPAIGIPLDFLLGDLIGAGTLKWGSGSLVGETVETFFGRGNQLFFDATLYPAVAYTVDGIHGYGTWTLSSVPDAAETSAPLAMSLAALGVAARRFRPAAS